MQTQALHLDSSKVLANTTVVFDLEGMPTFPGTVFFRESPGSVYQRFQALREAGFEIDVPIDNLSPIAVPRGNIAVVRGITVADSIPPLHASFSTAWLGEQDHQKYMSGQIIPRDTLRVSVIISLWEAGY